MCNVPHLMLYQPLYMRILPLSTLRLKYCFSQRFSQGRVRGRRRQNPRISVQNPGVSRVIPPQKIMAPSIRSSAGSSPRFKAVCIRFITSVPWVRSRYAPAIPVRIISPIVGQTPIILPAEISTYISRTGTIIKIMSNVINISVTPCV